MKMVTCFIPMKSRLLYYWGKLSQFFMLLKQVNDQLSDTNFHLVIENVIFIDIKLFKDDISVIFDRFSFIYQMFIIGKLLKTLNF